MRNYLIAKGALLGLLAVLMGAAGSHWFSHLLEDAEQRAYETAVSYQFYHALALLLSGIWYENNKRLWLLIAGYLFATGTVLFSGSIYLLTLAAKMKWLGPVTPLGGLCLVVAWVMLFIEAIHHLHAPRKKQLNGR
ncbi:MAG: DUF423 domain-containing protein [Chitinophagales bacterium]|nr:DUF423 domain-containing protein [Chitinophagales bacterium]MDW8427465.1 DUF423 domain-containing protein [Chitinophagales bacterium]